MTAKVNTPLKLSADGMTVQVTGPISKWDPDERSAVFSVEITQSPNGATVSARGRSTRTYHPKYTPWQAVARVSGPKPLHVGAGGSVTFGVKIDATNVANGQYFGWIKLVQTDEIELDSLVARLGPEALSEGFTPAFLQSQLDRHKRAPIKPVILDQSTVAGIGNIYADECLHLARLHPQRLCGSLTSGEVKRLHAAIRDIIASGIEHGGTSFSSYVNALGGKGDYLDHARVFRRDGQSCPLHPDTLIEKFKVAGRGTHICPKCQPKP